MPARPKTSDAQIIRAARELIEREGRDGFSMTDVAAAVGIRAQSLYSRSSLISGVEVEVCNEIASIGLHHHPAIPPTVSRWKVTSSGTTI
jgi:hypothetical protein